MSDETHPEGNRDAEQTAGQVATEPDPRMALVRLLAFVAAGVVLAYSAGALKTLIVVLAIILMIVLHEFGHFLTAKAAGMKVTEFFVGFGPRLWSVRKGETEYGVKGLPLGGYCKIPGMTNLEEVDPADEARTYRQKPYWRRLSVAVAGSTMHFILAFFLIFAALVFVGTQKTLPTIDGVVSLKSGPSPAEVAGFQKGDRVESYDGRQFTSWEAFRTYISSHAGVPMKVVVRRGTGPTELTVTPIDRRSIELSSPGAAATSSKIPVGFLGVTPGQALVKASPLGAVAKSGAELKNVTILTFKALGSIFSAHGISQYGHQLAGRPLSGSGSGSGEGRFTSPVGVVRLASQAADSGLGPVLLLLISINVFVGIFNMVPLLPLDGGHVAIATYERLRSRRGRRYHVDAAKLLPITYAAVLIIVFIGLSSLFLDLAHPAANPFQ